MLIAVVFAILLSISCLIATSLGLGKHLWNINPNLAELPEDVSRLVKVLLGCHLAYYLALTFTKLSILATYTRLFPDGIYRYTIYLIGTIVVIFWITSIFVIMLTCVPVQAAWDYSITNPKCIHILKYFYVSAAFNIGTDLILFFLPVSTIWKISVSRAQRVVVCLLFGMGTLCVFSPGSTLP
jgi:hypothetical protein